ncbi:BTAD domain-containing putative transcriptional regulator [Streptomyces sp. NPDC127098]|uniref:AfsR/SARP family transcriptional regulator n=1 Tax=Streptomyces sp. NPDC127098 TaxID=3347137 RepID=UPI0036608683
MSHDGVRFEVLGPVRALRGADEIPLGPPRQRAVLTALLLRAPRPVSAERVITTVWGDDAPAHAVNLVQKYVSGLRRCLPDSAPITLSSGGYSLHPGDGFDLWEFEQLLATARAARAGGRADTASEALTEATALWRGPLAEGIGGPGIELERDRLAEQQLIAFEDLYALGLLLGRGPDSVPELVRLAAEHPQRERLHGLLMRALAQSGRQIEALDVYARIRRRLADEYGTDPGPELRSAHQQVLSGATQQVTAEPTQDVPTAVPAQLPHEAFGFTGRHGQAEQITSLLRSDGMPIVYVEGTAGVGKTALVVHCAHQVADDFPDGQLFADLRGFDQLGPAHPTEILGGFLRALGIPAQRVPPDTRERSDLFRTLLAKRRVLVVLDNAAHADQIRPLLPGSRGCAVLITTRRGLPGLVAREGARRVVLPVLSAREAEHLLRTMLGPAAVGPAATQIARLCGYLPLALRLVAAGAAVRSEGLDTVAGQLAAEGPLAGAAIPGDESLSLSASLDLSYGTLDETARRVLRRLGLVPGPNLTRKGAAVVAGAESAETERVLHSLVAANLIEAEAPGLYRFPHDLLREYARKRALAEEPHAEREAAVHRLTAWSMRAASVFDGGSGRLFAVAPGGEIASAEDELQTRADRKRPPLAELANLAPLAEYAAEHGPYPAAWMLAQRLWGMCKHHSLMPEWLAGAQAGLRAARRAGDQQAEAELSISLVDAMLTAGRMEQAEQHALRALDLGRRHELPGPLAAAHEHLGRSRWLTGDLTEAHELLAEAVRRYGRLQQPLRLALALAALGRVDLDLGRPELAKRAYRTALRLAVAHRALPMLAVLRAELGIVLGALGDQEAAVASLEAAVAVAGELPRPIALGQAYLSTHLAALGERDRARVACQKGLSTAENNGDRWAHVEARNAVGRTLTLLGDTAGAITQHQAALAQSRGLSYRRGELHALAGLAEAAEHSPEGAQWARQATSLARRHGYAGMVRQLAKLDTHVDHDAEAREHEAPRLRIA